MSHTVSYGSKQFVLNRKKKLNSTKKFLIFNLDNSFYSRFSKKQLINILKSFLKFNPVIRNSSPLKY